MPLYEYVCDNIECKNFSNIWEAVHEVGNRGDETCAECGLFPRRLISKSVGKPVVMEYYSESLNARVTGPEHKRQLMKSQNLEEHDDLKEYGSSKLNKYRFEKVSADGG